MKASPDAVEDWADGDGLCALADEACVGCTAASRGGGWDEGWDEGWDGG